jgi:hypothetical protein
MIPNLVQRIKKRKLLFFAPLFIVLAILALIFWYIGPTVTMSFLYAIF